METELESIRPSLLGLLGALRLAYETHGALHETAPSQSEGNRDNADEERDTRRLEAAVALLRARASPEPRLRAAALEWSFALLRWSPFTLDTLLLSCGGYWEERGL